VRAAVLSGVRSVYSVQCEQASQANHLFSLSRF
jgi:hypothetical protein